MGRPGEGNRAGEYILCPLFVAYSDKEICCKPHVPDAQMTVIKYPDKKSCSSQRQMFCEGCWRRCEQYLTWLHFRWEDEK